MAAETVADAVAADAAFGTDLRGRLPAADNTVLSPASIATALRMALAGARGETAAEMAAALHMPAADPAAGLGLLGEVRVGGDTTFRAPNTMWIQSGLVVRQQFLDQPVTVRYADYAGRPGEARDQINADVAGQTEGKISDLIPAGMLDALTRLVLVNAVYLMARWEHAFPPDGTRETAFHTELTGAYPVQNMHLRARLAYARGDGYQAVLLPYAGCTLAMQIVLPDGHAPDFAEAVPVSVRAWERPLVSLSMPRFRISARFVLREALRDLGIRLAFSPGDADFSGITGDRSLYISQVAHQAYIDVTEQGTEAAAATGVVMKTLAAVREPRPDVTMVVDRPFLFAIVDTATGLPLFSGQIARP